MENEFWQISAFNQSALLKVAEMYRADQMAPISSTLLMEKAGQGVVDVLLEEFGRRDVLILCGPGNNGGDGFVVARILKNLGIRVRLALGGEKSALKGDAALNAERFDGEILPLSPELIEPDELVVDALLGAGLTRPVDGLLQEVVERINQLKLPVLSVDIPTGINGDTGEIMGSAIKAQVTVTFFRKKPGHLLYPGHLHCGEIRVVDIGIPAEVLKEIKPTIYENSPLLWPIPVPDWTSHKYSRGHALVLGSLDTSGAARLAARAARRVGAGLCTVAAPQIALILYALSAPGGLTSKLDRPGELIQILKDKRKNAVLIGPGMGFSPETLEYLEILVETHRPLVIDADAISVMAGSNIFLHQNCLLTPHMGEFARLFPEIKGNRLDMALNAAAKSNAHILFKGADSVIATPSGFAFVNSLSSPYLATAGSGDVLAGIIVGLLAQGMNVLAAAGLGAYLHGLAGVKLGPGLIAEDIPEILPSILGDIIC